MKNLLVVIDMVNGFVNFGALADKKIGKVIPNIENLILDAKRNNYRIVAFKDSHSLGDEEFKYFPVHCLKGSEESELVPALKVYEKDMKIIEKDTTNGFITREFKNLLKNEVFDNVYICGCCTDICVINFVGSFLEYIQKNKLNTKINVIENACYTFDGKDHNAKMCHDKAILDMKNHGANILTSDKQNER